MFAVATTSAVFLYYAWKDNHPGEQLPFDPSKKTVVVLGSGWGATSFLRSLDTEDYNVVCLYYLACFTSGPVAGPALPLASHSISARTSHLIPRVLRFCVLFLLHDALPRHGIFLTRILLLDASHHRSWSVRRITSFSPRSCPQSPSVPSHLALSANVSLA